MLVPSNQTPNYIHKKVITDNVGPLCLANREYVNNDIKIAEIPNEYFASLFTLEVINAIEETSCPN